MENSGADWVPTLEGKKMRAIVLLLAVIPCVASLSETAMGSVLPTDGFSDPASRRASTFNCESTDAIWLLVDRI